MAAGSSGLESPLAQATHTTSLQEVLGRLLGALLAVALGLLGVFLFAVFVAVAALLALAGMVRLWWLGGTRRPPRGGTMVTTQYTVTEATTEAGEAREPDAILPPRRDGRD